MSDPIMDVLQEVVEDGWVPSQYVVIVAYEKYTGDSSDVGLSQVVYTSGSQPDYATDGLLREGKRVLKGLRKSRKVVEPPESSR